MILAGLLLTVLGPLLLLLPIALLVFLFGRAGLGARLGLSADNARLLHVAAAGILVLGAVLTTYLPGRIELERLCGELAEPRILERTRVEGFFLDDLTANSFGLTTSCARCWGRAASRLRQATLSGAHTPRDG